MTQDSIARRAWELVEANPETLPADVARMYRRELQDEGTFTLAELDEAEAVALAAIVNG